MNFIKKFNRVSGKMKIYIYLSALWTLFWLLASWQERDFLGGFTFGGIPLAITWAFWAMAKKPHEETDLIDNLQNVLKSGSHERRKFVRLGYPSTKRPVLKFGEHEIEVMDISENGIRLLNDKKIDLGQSIHGEIVLLSGRSMRVDGEVQWSLNNEVGLLMALIPSTVIDKERRVLSGKKIFLGERLETPISANKYLA